MKKQGGKRKGAGRKKVKDKKVSVTIQIRRSIIDNYGGKDATRIFLLSKIDA